VKNCLSPQFSRAFELDYYFEEVQKLRFAVYDIDNKTPQVSDDDFLGQIECTLGEVCEILLLHTVVLLVVCGGIRLIDVSLTSTENTAVPSFMHVRSHF